MSFAEFFYRLTFFEAKGKSEISMLVHVVTKQELIEVKTQAAMNDGISNKRKRVDADLSAGTDHTDPMIRLSDALPTGVLSHAASYLAAPSRALFAATLFGNDMNDENRSKIAGN